MSKPHLRALEDALARKGWRVIAVHPGDDYSVSATWEVQRSSNEPSLFLDFDGLGGEGDFCLPLEESYGCQVRGRKSASLYFRRVNKSRKWWERELAEFVRSLDDEGRAEHGIGPAAEFGVALCRKLLPPSAREG